MSKIKVLAVASQGGHLVQLFRIIPALGDNEVKVVSNVSSYRGVNITKVIDANMDQKLRLLAQAFSIFTIVFSFRPRVVVSTGASIGLFAILFGRLVGAKCLWIDSVANAQELSLAGRIASRVATCTLSQWEDVADQEDVLFRGRVI